MSRTACQIAGAHNESPATSLATRCMNVPSLSCIHDADRMPDCAAAAAKVNDYIVVVGSRRSNVDWASSVVAAVIFVTSTSFVSTEVRVCEQHDVCGNLNRHAHSLVAADVFARVEKMSHGDSFLACPAKLFTPMPIISNAALCNDLEETWLPTPIVVTSTDSIQVGSATSE